MSFDGLIVRACADLFDQEPMEQTRLSGGCIHDVLLIECTQGASCVMKFAPGSERELLSAEMHNLQALSKQKPTRSLS